MNYNDYFAYDDGKIFWTSKTTDMAHNIRLGDEAGTCNGLGYKRVMLFGKHTMVHHIVWIMHGNEIPKGMEVDHLDHDRRNNRIENLRLVDRGVNMRNKSTYRNSKTGHHGVTIRPDSGKYRAKITINKKVINLGTFDSIDDAISARKDAEVKYGFHANHGV
ncbi:HNH endonuclease [Enterobacteria phage vB_EcoS_Rogue1]|uniref:Putative HNH endonuclease n=1 Tax=Enterobacteria phage vB_EcoS_Rogue1 TaxID=1147155 RepID=K7PL64_9CAUD|nr:HNH endonuclease [Enterobacteria phage vB_EcoS_Rogue1]AFM76575.1 putative HNH endonuclease [Enterobacteria phage vB_EcoS_Rogue1]